MEDEAVRLLPKSPKRDIITNHGSHFLFIVLDRDKNVSLFVLDGIWLQINGRIRNFITVSMISDDSFDV